MLYKHWKKIALTMTALFWASCDDTSTSSGANGEQSSSSFVETSSSFVESSSSYEVPVPTYGCGAIECPPPLDLSSSSNIKESSSSNIAESSSSEVAQSSSSFEVPVPAYGGIAVYCYNDTAVNDSGKSFDIVECDDGQKYLRFQDLYMDLPEKQKELPEGVNPVPPIPTLGSFYAQNCTREPDICIDGFTIDDNGNEQPVGGCYPSIECPEKPQT